MHFLNKQVLQPDFIGYTVIGIKGLGETTLNFPAEGGRPPAVQNPIDRPLNIYYEFPAKTFQLPALQRLTKPGDY